MVGLKYMLHMSVTIHKDSASTVFIIFQRIGAGMKLGKQRFDATHFIRGS